MTRSYNLSSLNGVACTVAIPTDGTHVFYSTPLPTHRRRTAITCVIIPKGNIISLPPDTSAKVVDNNTISKKDVERLLQSHLSIRGMMIGSDPELFIIDNRGQVIPAFKFLPAKSSSTRVYWDGFQAELAPPPNTCLAYATDSVQKCMQDLYDYAKRYNPNAILVHNDVVDIPAQMLREADSEHVALGCKPSYNIYGSVPVSDIDPRQLTIRSAGCHFHIDTRWPKSLTVKAKLIEDCVMAMDTLAGVMSVTLLQGLEDQRRRQLYGRAGEFRLPKYGLEYRVISSAILAHPLLYHLMFDTVRAAMAIGRAGVAPILLNSDPCQVQQAINNYDIELAKRIINTNWPVYDMIYRRAYLYHNRKRCEEALYNLITEGAVKSIPRVRNVAANWRLNTSQQWVPHSGAKDCCVSSWLDDIE